MKVYEDYKSAEIRVQNRQTEIQRMWGSRNRSRPIRISENQLERAEYWRVHYKRHIREVGSLCSKNSISKYGWWNTDPLILNFDIRWLWDVSFTFRSLYPLNTAFKRSCNCLIQHSRCLATAWYCIQDVLRLPDTAFQMSCDCLIQHSRCLATAWYCIQDVLRLPDTAFKMSCDCLIQHSRCLASKMSCDCLIQH
jgi:hypothetical protein